MKFPAKTPTDQAVSACEKLVAVTQLAPSPANLTLYDRNLLDLVAGAREG